MFVVPRLKKNQSVSIFMRYRFLVLVAWVLCAPVVVSAHPAWGLVVDTVRQVIYFSDLEQVWRIDATGDVSVFVPDVHSHDLFLGPNGVLYGEHEWYDAATDIYHTRHWKATPEGDVSYVPWAEASAYFLPHDPQGNAYRIHTSRDSASTWITKLSPEGRAFVLAGGSWGYADGRQTEARFRLPGHAVWGADHLYMTNGGVVRKMNADGEVETLAGPEQGFEHSMQKNGSPRYSALLGLAVAPDGTVYFADIDQRKLFQALPDGSIEIVIDYGLGWMPVGVTTVGGELYVVEYRTTASRIVARKKGPRVRKRMADGTFAILGVAN